MRKTLLIVAMLSTSLLAQGQQPNWSAVGFSTKAGKTETLHITALDIFFERP